MLVMKFGGAVLKSPDGFLKMLEIIKDTEDDQILIVISAFAKSTRNLRTASELAEKGNYQEASELINQIIEEYSEYAKSIIKSNQILKLLSLDYEVSSKKVKDLLKGVSITRELTARTLDAVLSTGEQISLSTAYHYLSENGINLALIDSSNIIVTDSNYGKAVPILEKTQENIDKIILPALKSYGAVITQGFVARNTEKEITTMGLESSNLTAAIYTSLLNADKLIIWTDVKGIRSEDPKQNPESDLIKYLSYNQAYLCSVLGLKLIFPEMIDILKSSQKALYIQSAFNNEDYTEITPVSNNSHDYIIINRDNIKTLSIDIESHLQKDTLLKIFAKIPNDLIVDFSISDSRLFIAYSNIAVENYFKGFEKKIEDSKFKALINFKGDYSSSYRSRINSLLFEFNYIIHSEINSEITKIYYK